MPVVGHYSAQDKLRKVKKHLNNPQMSTNNLRALLMIQKKKIDSTQTIEEVVREAKSLLGTL